MRNLLFFILSAFIISACGSRDLNEATKYEPVTNGACTPVEHRFVTPQDKIKNVFVSIDETFSDENKGIIIDALNIWRSYTKYTLEYTIVCIGDVSNAKQVDGNIIIMNRDPGLAQGVAGQTYWFDKKINATISLPDSFKGGFEKITLHELGHAFNLMHDHSPYTSIIKEYIGDTTVPQCQDIQAFCANWGCTVDCQPTLLPIAPQSINLLPEIATCTSNSGRSLDF